MQLAAAAVEAVRARGWAAGRVDRIQRLKEASEIDREPSNISHPIPYGRFPGTPAIDRPRPWKAEPWSAPGHRLGDWQRQLGRQQRQPLMLLVHLRDIGVGAW